ncbi:MAG: FAD-dependent oxidoreductase [Bacteroidetes bacterium]|jgi:NADH dehydrogenase|nr:FAD-dependent oxidoreductase [Bacteroidota bacterium]
MKNEFNINIPETEKPRVIIVGGGFAGVNLVRKLKGKNVQVVLFDRYNYHTFQPLLYQVSTAGLEPDSVAGPLRKIIESIPDFHFRMIKVLGVDTKNNKLHTLVGDIEFDFLAIATGARMNYFGNEEIMKNAMPMKQLPHALDLRSYLFQQLEQATLKSNPDEVKQLLTFIVVGGGPTGVELAGALAELKRHVLPKDYPTLDLAQMRIILVEGMNSLLPQMSAKAGKITHKYLSKMGVDIRLGQLINNYDGNYVTFKDGHTLQAQTVIWAAGVKGNPLEGLPVESIYKGRIVTNEYNQVFKSDNEYFNNIFALGDVAMIRTKDLPEGYPMLAPVAIQQGRHAARNIVNAISNKNLKPFRYVNKGALATVGRNKAIGDLPGNIFIAGFVGWVIWLFVHLMYLIGFRNKLVVFTNWVWNYFSYDRGIRLIVRPYVKQNDPLTKELAEEYLEK